LNNKKNINILNDLLDNGDDDSEFLNNLKSKANSFFHTINDYDIRIKSLELESKNGISIVKITNINEKLLEAKYDRLSYIDSHPFYTSEYGFKLCTRIYLNGDGESKNTHLSIYLIILKSEHDSLLNWPFKFKVTFSLLGTNNQNNLIKSFNPDPNALNSFERPKNDMNKPSGLKYFCSLAEIDKFIIKKDNCIFIKTQIDTINILSIDY